MGSVQSIFTRVTMMVMMMMRFLLKMKPGQGSGGGEKESEAKPLMAERDFKIICEGRAKNGNDSSCPSNKVFIFGPAFRNSVGNSLEVAKDESWRHVVSKTDGSKGPSLVKDIYLYAIREVEEEARNSYGEGTVGEEDRASYDHTTVEEMLSSDFMGMMIEDGCLFLQLAVSALGGYELLGHNDNSSTTEMILGASRDSNEMNEPLEAMFAVGNQIPLVVLNQLMKQTFFQKVVKEGYSKQIWGQQQPSHNLYRRVLYEELVLPHGPQTTPKSWLARYLAAALRSFRWGSNNNAAARKEPPPCDILHALHCLLVGPGQSTSRRRPIKRRKTKMKPSNNDLEAGLGGQGDQGARGGQGDHVQVGDDKHFPSATELEKKGISFSKLSSSGIRGICFRYKYKIFRPTLYLPVLNVDEITESVLSNLVKYEEVQKFDDNRREVSSYVRLLRELIKTDEDATTLHKAKIIGGDIEHREMLPDILADLNCKGTTHNIHLVRLQISDYYKLPWERYRDILSIVFFFTAAQTVYTILGYYHGR